MTTQTGSRFWRWATLVITVINIIFNYLSQGADLPGRPINEVTDQYRSLFTPAGYAFSIWGLIYLSFIIYSVYQLLPKQRNDGFYDRLNLPFILANILAMLWQVVFRNEYIGLSVCVISTMTILAAIMFVKVKARTGNINSWISMPFSLFLGWICVATIANIAILLVSLGWEGGDMGASVWTVIMLATALLLSIALCARFGDVIILLVIAWATFAIHIETRTQNTFVSTVALIVAIIAILSSLLTLLTRKTTIRNTAHS